jgi:hypothetical protein
MRSVVVGTLDGRTNLLGGRVVYGGDETTDLVAHGFGSYSSGGGLEINVARSANASIEGVTARHKRSSHDDRTTSNCEEKEERREQLKTYFI